MSENSPEPSEATPLYQVRNLVKHYPHKHGAALDVPALSIPQGGIVAVLGFSGAGKSTLLNQLGLLDTPDPPAAGTPAPSILYRGRWELCEASRNGKDPGERDLQDIRRNDLGFVFQESHLLRHFDAIWNVELPLHLNGRLSGLGPGEMRHEHARRLLEAVGLSGATTRRLPKRLSVGQAQRVALARALAHDPHVLFADEATGSLDPLRAQELMHALEDWCSRREGRDEERTVLWVTHNVALAAEHATHHIVMSNGRVLGQLEGKREAGELLELLAEHRQDELPTVVLPRLPADSPAASPRWLRFAARFAVQDFIPRSGGDDEVEHLGADQPQQAAGRARRAGLPAVLRDLASNALNVFVVAGLILTALLIARVTITFQEKLEETFIDPLVNFLVVDQGEMDALDDTALDSVRALEQSGSGLVEAAHGVYRASLTPDVPSDDPFGSRPALDYWAMAVEDPLLTRVPLLDAAVGAPLAGLTASERTVADLFKHEDGDWAPGRRGLVLTRDALAQVLDYQTVPADLPIVRQGGPIRLPLLGVTEWLPGGRDMLLSEGQHLHLWRENSPLARNPPYALLLVYPPDIRDAGRLVEGLRDIGLDPETDILRNLDWVQSTERLLNLFIGLGLGLLALLSASNLFLSMAQTVRRKRNELGVLLAFGAPRSVVQAIFTIEALMSFSLGAVLALLLQHPLVGSCEQLLARSLSLDPKIGLQLANPTWLVPSILGGTALVTVTTVWLALRREMGSTAIADLVRARD